ncbi:glycerol-3-phosphate transporter [Gordonia polyisoprenivorans NBRC 16320 = JCM 10675]|uniref:MFS transporter n=1 Tax=Gordonia polyisoprenivorans TaxID=84595 RepID=A0A846WT40_9ACTN|nr:MFS transporter [Gordonia polyisoprenivorans]NKY03900.1 MFS transporter [Gordonia polyisoprenivorans]GAB24211.1 glycerol-3-phosphate transporter [Gordonia polyisoprenivorans NBRC 16320 = JCM 10675]
MSPTPRSTTTGSQSVADTTITATTDITGSYRRWRIQIFAITWIIYAGFYFTRQAFSVAKLGILEDPILSTSLSKEVLANLDAVYLTAYACGQFVWGALSDRIGPRRVLLGGLVASAFAAVFMGLLPALLFLVPLMVMQGLAQSTGWSGTLTNMAKFFTIAERGRILGLWSTNYAFGGLAAAPFLGWIAYSIFDSWRVAFFAGAVVVLIVAVATWRLQRNAPSEVGLPEIEEFRSAMGEPAPVGEVTDDEHEMAREISSSGWQNYRAVLGNSMVLTLGATYFLLKPARYAILLWGPVIVAERLTHASNLEAITIPVAFGVAGVAAPILFGFLSDRVFHAKRIPACVLSLCILIAALVLFTPLTATGNVWIMVAVLAVIGLTLYGADAMVSCVSAVDFGTSKHAGAATGIINGCGSVGAIFGGLLPGYLGTTALFYGFAGAAAIAAVILARHWNRVPSNE